VKRPQVLDASLQRLIEKVDIVDEVLVVNLATFQQLQLLQHLALHHRDGVVCVILALRRLLKQVLHHHTITDFMTTISCTYQLHSVHLPG